MLRTSVNVTGDAAVACIVADSEELIDKNLFNK
jgi:Na+/H+-dicarboxylate symporter